MTWRYLERKDLGLTVDLRWARLPDELLDREEERMARALDAMEALEAGAVANPDEGRRVGHYWLRAPQLAPEAAITEAIEGMQEEVTRFVAGLGGRFRDVLQVGIGGSALGPQLVADALGSPGDARRVHVVDNVDPDGVHEALRRVDPDDALVLVVSKSGGTVETRHGARALREALEARGLSFPERAVAVTGEGSALARQAETEGWCGRFPMWDWVGGRTSVTSAVGLLPMALQGLDTDAFLEGAAAVDAATRSREIGANPAALLALAWHEATEGHARRAMVALPYRDRLRLLARYLQQLLMESLGKRFDRQGHEVQQGLTVYGHKGSTDQHAYVQQLREGPDDVFVELVEVLDDGPADPEVAPGVTMGDALSGFLAGTRRALFEAGRPCITLTLDRLDARRLGGLIALHERAVGLYAELVDVNAYHQPGVEAGKKAAAELLDLQGALLARIAEGHEGDAGELARLVGGDPDDAFHVLRHLAANGRVRATGRGLERRFAAMPEG